MIHIYYGYGKGKTTASIGLGMRACGAGMKVLFVQFLKDNKSSELKAIPFEIFEGPDSLPFNPDSSYLPWVESAINYVKNSSCDVIILDEFLDIINKLITVDEALELINSIKDKEIIITGHNPCDKLFDRADYLTHMEKERHPFDNGIQARIGIEY